MLVLLGYLVFPVGLVRFLCGARSGSFAHRVGQLLALAFAAGSAWFSYYLFATGEKARWSSDGAGILFVMIAMALAAGLAVAFGWLLLWSFSRDDAGEEDRFAGVRTAVAVLLLLAIALPAARAGWGAFPGRHSHDADVVSLYLTADGAELRSVDEGRVTKSWDAESGRHRQTRPKGGLAEAPAYGPSGGMLLTAWQFAYRYHVLHRSTDLDALDAGREIHVPLAALAPDGEVVTANGGYLQWAKLDTPHDRVRYFHWTATIRDIAVGARGEVVLVDDASRLVTVSGAKPEATRVVELPRREYRKLAFSPSGATLVAVDAAGAALAVLASGEVRELPGSAVLELFAWDGPDSLVCGRQALTRVSFADLTTRPLTGPIPRATALVASRAGRVFFASGPDVYVLKPRWWKQDALARVVRLTDYRFSAAGGARRR